MSRLGTFILLILLSLLILMSLAPIESVQSRVLFTRFLFRLLIFLFSLLWNAKRNPSNKSPDCETPVHEVKYNQENQK